MRPHVAVAPGLLAVLRQQHHQPHVLRPVQQDLPEDLPHALALPVEEQERGGQIVLAVVTMSLMEFANMGQKCQQCQTWIEGNDYGWQGCVEGPLKLQEHKAVPKCCYTGSW